MFNSKIYALDSYFHKIFFIINYLKKLINSNKKLKLLFQISKY